MKKTIKNLFTPRISYTSNKRLKMSLSEADKAKIGRGRMWSAEVTDLLTNKRYKVEGAACSFPSCFCDAVIVGEELEKNLITEAEYDKLLEKDQEAEV